MKRSDFVAVQFSSLDWGKPVGKKHLEYFPEGWEFKSPNFTLCGINSTKRNSRVDGWHGSIDNWDWKPWLQCSKCKRVFKQRLKSGCGVNK